MGFKNRQRKFHVAQLSLHANQLTFASRIGRGHDHHAFANGRHLRPTFGVDDGGDDAAAEGRSNLQQEVLVILLGHRVGVVANLQIGAVGGQATLGGAGHGRGQITAQRRRAIEHNLWAMLGDQAAHHVAVGGGLIGLELGIFDQVRYGRLKCDVFASN